MKLQARVTVLVRIELDAGEFDEEHTLCTIDDEARRAATDLVLVGLQSKNARVITEPKTESVVLKVIR